MCYSGCFWDTGRYSLLSLSFLTKFFSNDSVVLFLLLSPLFIVLFQSPEEPLIPLFCSLGTRTCFVPIAQKVETFLVYHFFFLLMSFLRKPMANFSIPECACFLCHFPYGSTFGRPSSLSFFLNGQNPTLLVRKYLLLLPFLQLLVLVP